MTGGGVGGRMDERILFDQIKRKEADIIHTLQNIAEAAFITESLQRSGSEAEAEVDSDLREMAKSTHGLMEDNSEPDFEDIIDDAVEINDTGPELLEVRGDETTENKSGLFSSDGQEKFTEKPQTVIKLDIMEEINDTEIELQNHKVPEKIPQTSIGTRPSEENPVKEQEGEEEGVEESDQGGDSTGSWKIDYIRVETEEEKKVQKKAAVKNELWSTAKPKKEKSRKRHSSRKSSKKPEVEGRKIKRKDSFSFPTETKASRLDKSHVKLRSKSRSKKSQNRTWKSVENWKEILKISSVDSSDLDQVLESVVDSYSPSVPTGTSQYCIENLSESDIEVLPCPACRDKFFLPTTFFQHILRKSIEITYNCQCCGKVLVFHNKCSLKIHILNHLESENITTVETDMLNVMSLDRSDLRLNSDMRDFTQELSRVMNNVDQSPLNCPECFKSLEDEDLLSHLSGSQKSSERCEDCEMSLPSKCSYSAHRRIHAKKSPYICPECGLRFHTWSYFRRHVLTTCHHERRVLLSVCPCCPDQDKFTADRSSVLLHIADNHCRQYWKCSLCPSAFVDKEKSLTHLREKHEESGGGGINVLYKMSSKSQSQFFSSKSSLLDHLERSVSVSRVSLFSCVGCEEKFWTSEDLSTHLQSSPGCGRQEEEEDSALFPSEPENTERFREIRDNLRVIQQETDCSSCLKYNENFQKHIEKHQRLEKQAVTDVRKVIVEEEKETSKRVTRLMKRSRSSEFESGHTPSVVKIESQAGDFSSSPPLKLKIRLLPEVSKAVDPPVPVTPVVTPVTVAVSQPIVKKEEKKGKSKGSKVKFSLPEPLVQPLGVDLCSGKDLILLNRLFHSPDAFLSGSVVRVESPSPGFRCALCDLTETDRTVFLSHITQHKSCQSYFQCLECGTCFAAEPSWRKHLLLMHRIKDPGPQLYCQPLTQDFSQLEEDEEEEMFDQFEDSGSEGGNLVIDTGEAEEVSYPGHVPTCLACGETFSSSGQFKQHKCGQGQGQAPFQGLKLR